MIKIEKSSHPFDVPASLRIPNPQNFELRTVPEQAKTTHKRRLDLIADGGYIDVDIYNSRYKMDDIKTLLSKIYHSKCAFCEQKVEQFHVEHYRPKLFYYWLAYSWDNLLVACPKCNSYKGINFMIAATTRASFNGDFDTIHRAAGYYDQLEQPFLVNPENTNPRGFVIFDNDGKINSDNGRFLYTINTCRLNRNFLIDCRKKIFDDFLRSVERELVIHRDLGDKTRALATLVRKFVSESQDDNNEYLAFRRYAVDHLLKPEINRLLKK